MGRCKYVNKICTCLLKKKNSVNILTIQFYVIRGHVALILLISYVLNGFYKIVSLLKVPNIEIYYLHYELILLQEVTFNDLYTFIIGEEADILMN